MHLVPDVAGNQNTLSPDLNAVFPLRLSDFEYYMLLDDRPTHPMVFVMVIDVRGSLQREPLDEAAGELLQAHPLLNCRVEHRSVPGWCWVPITNSSSIVEWRRVSDDEVKAFIPQVRAIELRTVPGIQIEVAAADSSARIAMSFHHACCDGLAALQLVGELLARYGQKTALAGQKTPEFQPTELGKLLQRENYETGEAAAQRQKRSLGRIVGKVARLLFRSPVMLASSADFTRNAPRENPPASTLVSVAEESIRKKEYPRPAILSAIVSKATHRALRAVAAQQSVSINDLFIREMILHVRDWNRRGGLRFGRRWIRIAVPLSMRTVVHENMPAANVVSYALVTRREQDCDDPAGLVKSIHEQTSDVLYNREGIVCLKLFRILRKIPGAMKAFLSFKTVLSTMVLANVGDVRRRFSGRFPLEKGKWVAGNVVVEKIHGVAPVRPNTRAAMSIGDYAGELSLSLRTDGLVLDADHTQQFLCDFVRRLRDLAEHAEESQEDSIETEPPAFRE